MISVLMKFLEFDPGSQLINIYACISALFSCQQMIN